MTKRFQIFGLLALALVACDQSTILESPGLAPDLDVGETTVADYYQLTDGFETQGWTCNDDDDGIFVDDPSTVQVTKLGEAPITAHTQDIYATKYALTGLKVGRVVVTMICRGQHSEFYLYVR